MKRMNTFAISKVNNTRFDSNKNNTRCCSKVFEHMLKSYFCQKKHGLILHVKKLKLRDTLQNTAIL